jgi:hypothetical protein
MHISHLIDVFDRSLAMTRLLFINANGLRTEIRDQSLTAAKSAIQELAIHW